MQMTKSNPNRTYVGVLPKLLERIMTQPIGHRFSVQELTDQVGEFTLRQVTDSLRHAADTGRLLLAFDQGRTEFYWHGLGPSAKVADRERMASADRLRRQLAPVIGVAAQDIPAGGSGTVALRPVPALPAPEVHGSGCYTLVRELRDGALLLESGDGELYKAVRI